MPRSNAPVRIEVKKLQPRARLTADEAQALISLRVPLSSLLELSREQLQKKYPQAFK